jgi:hypothetical protein
MSLFATLAATERRLLIDQVATRLGLVAVIVEKDFWVCWTLGRIFATAEVGPHVVFKGGTSLFKVFRVITRFSEDIDLSVAPASLGVPEQYLDEAPSTSQRTKRTDKLARRCEERVREAFQPALEAAIAAVLREPPTSPQWLSYAIDPIAGTPNLWFEYPSVLPQPGGYVAKRVKIEIGTLTRQQPTGDYPIAPLLVDALGESFEDFRSRVVALELERTFWEKATILHAEFHRPRQKSVRDRFSRHYSDFASLWSHASRDRSLARLDILEDVTRHKSRFFASSWASYDTARPGTFRLLPPVTRHAELGRDYEAMRPMFLGDPQPFAEMLDQLARAEELLNAP